MTDNIFIKPQIENTFRIHCNIIQKKRLFIRINEYLLNQQTVPLKGTIQRVKALAKSVKKTEIIS